MNSNNIIENLKHFIDKSIIVGGYGSEYKVALLKILSGADWLEVLEWYNNILTNNSNKAK